MRVALSAVAVAFLAANAAPAALAGLVPDAAPAPAGGLVIAGSWLIHDTDLRLSGDLVVLPGARLTLRDATVTFATALDHHPGIRVAAGGTLAAERVTFTNDAAGAPAQRAAAYWPFEVHGRADLSSVDVTFVRAIAFDGPASRGNRVTDSTVSHAAVAAFTFRDQASGLVARNHVRSTFDLAPTQATGGGVSILDTDDVRIESNLFEDVRGGAVIAVQSSTVGSYTYPTAAVIERNLIYDSSAHRDAAGLGTWGIYVDGGSATRVADNAVASALVGIGTAFGSAATVTGNDVLGFRPPGGSLQQALVGLRANATVPEGREAGYATFTGNRVRGFAVATQALEGGGTVLRGNALADTNAVHLQATPSAAAVDARGNWWGGGVPRTQGPVDVRAPLAADPWAERGFDVKATFTQAGLAVTTFNRGEATEATIVLRNAPGAPASLLVPVAGGASTFVVPLHSAPPSGTDAVVLARALNGVAAVAVAGAP